MTDDDGGGGDDDDDDDDDDLFTVNTPCTDVSTSIKVVLTVNK
jgi:hypothetical protein